MKKTIVALAILLTCMGFIPIDAANWYWVGADSSGDQWYIDNQSASKSYDVAVVWVKIVREDGTHELNQMEITRVKNGPSVRIIDIPVKINLG